MVQVIQSGKFVSFSNTQNTLSAATSRYDHEHLTGTVDCVNHTSAAISARAGHLHADRD